MKNYLIQVTFKLLSDVPLKNIDDFLLHLLDKISDDDEVQYAINGFVISATFSSDTDINIMKEHFNKLNIDKIEKFLFLDTDDIITYSDNEKTKQLLKIQEELDVNTILDKISKNGISSLSKKELNYLNQN